MRMKSSIILLSIAFLFISWSSPERGLISADQKQADNTKAFNRNKNIGRGINFGNALEAPNEGDWGLVIKESYIQAVADAGFNSVRLPICWSAHNGTTSPYTINAAFLQRVDEVMNWCLTRNLAVIITIHHFDNLYNYPDNAVYKSMFFSIWHQLTDHYSAVDHERLFFEVLNEPEVNLTADKWNVLMPQIIDSIRAKDSDRTLIIDGPDYAYHGSLTYLKIPVSEQNVIVSTRYYLPYQFAQQGAWWSNWIDLNQFLGTTWSGASSEKNAVQADMSIITNWATQNNRPITIGEYGSIMFADNQSRLTWTNYVRTQFENKGFSWSYFDFGVVFKAYSIAENKWLTGFVEALTGNSAAVLDGRSAESIHISPAAPTKNDKILITSYIKIPNLCSPRDSVRITQNGSIIKITSYHPEYIPQSNSTNTCVDSVQLGSYAPGNYQLIFNSDYIDKLNTLHYSILDTMNIQISNSTGLSELTSNSLKVYPVPASQYIILENIEAGSPYRIIDMSGQVKDTGQVAMGRILISNLKSGEYILQITKNAKIVLNKKIMVSHS